MIVGRTGEARQQQQLTMRTTDHVGVYVDFWELEQCEIHDLAILLLGGNCPNLLSACRRSRSRMGESSDLMSFAACSRDQ